VFFWFGVTQIGEEGFGSMGALWKRSGFKVGEEEGTDDVACGELAGAFLFFAEEHAKKSGEEGTLDFVEVLEGECRGRESFEAEEDFME
jgi:hypothetical protein